MEKTNKILDWDFQAKTQTAFKVDIYMKTQSGVFNMIFKKAAKKIADKGIYVERNKEITEFNVPDMYKRYVTTILKKIFINIIKEVRKDKVEVLEYWLSDVKFKKVGEVWKIKAIYEGVYIDKR